MNGTSRIALLSTLILLAPAPSSAQTQPDNPFAGPDFERPAARLPSQRRF